MLRTVLRSTANCVAISALARRSTWNNRWTCRQQSSRTIRPSPSGVTSGPVSPSAGASPDNIISLMSTPSSVRRGEENSMTTAGDYWMTADRQPGEGPCRFMQEAGHLPIQDLELFPLEGGKERLKLRGADRIADRPGRTS